MHMQNLSNMGVLDTPALMHRLVIAVLIRVSSMQRVKLENEPVHEISNNLTF